jgi:hypothetical protein
MVTADLLTDGRVYGAASSSVWPDLVSARLLRPTPRIASELSFRMTMCARVKEGADDGRPLKFHQQAVGAGARNPLAALVDHLGAPRLFTAVTDEGMSMFPKESPRGRRGIVRRVKVQA